MAQHDPFRVVRDCTYMLDLSRIKDEEIAEMRREWKKEDRRLQVQQRLILAAMTVTLAIWICWGVW